MREVIGESSEATTSESHKLTTLSAVERSPLLLLAVRGCGRVRFSPPFPFFFMVAPVKKAPHKPGCMVVHVIVAALLLLLSLAALVGVYKSHVLLDGLAFGTTSGSLAIIAFVAAVMAFMRQMKACSCKCDVCSVK
jgi:hypothetical protein